MALRLADIDPNSKADIARTLSALEAAGGTVRHAALVDEAAAASRAHRVGLTGPPGVGKSTLTNCLIRAWRAASLTVAVIAVDPSSRISGGALLGDRTRLTVDPNDRGIFVRSFAARDRLGGLSDDALAAIRLLGAFYDRVLVESVGIGQSESDLAYAVDTAILCVQPGSGDSLQFMKAGIMEIPDLVVVTKADRGADARRAAADVEGALSLTDRRDNVSPVLLVSAETGEGLDTLMTAMDDHRAHLLENGRLAERRAGQAEFWFRDAIRRRFGTVGVQAVDRDLAAGAASALYQTIAKAEAVLKERFR